MKDKEAASQENFLEPSLAGIILLKNILLSRAKICSNCLKYLLQETPLER